ncbi:MAG: cbb3-type cytochrome c oxidase subunit 3 [Alphaproteobacteria bacterium]|nr:cbb3-type cytochrome c oxidase subunit 3 [Alphaproteobacteria bacterium]
MIDWITHNAGLVGLLFFFVFFTIMALWIYRPGAKGTYQNLANIPLKEGEND